MKTALSCAVLSACLSSALAETLSFDEGWEFRREGDAEWSRVTLPHDWAIGCEPLTNVCPRQGDLPFAGKGFYRKRFAASVPEGGKAYLEIGGAMSESAVRLNGRLLAERKYGYSSYVVDLTDALSPDGNLLEVVCENKDRVARWYPGAGLYRSVRLRVVPKEHVLPGTLFIRTLSATTDRAELALDYETSSGKVSKSFTVENPRLWSPETPELYEIEILGEKFRYGIRTAVFDPEKGFFLNGRHRQMKGVCLHHDLGPLGAAFHTDAARRQLALLKEMGCDAVRTSHNPPAPEFLDLCDEMGVLVMDEAFDTWEKCKEKNDYGRFFAEWHERDLVDFVRRDRSHPSVVMWSVGNEVAEFSERNSANARRVGGELVALVRREDPTRPVTMGSWTQWTITNGVEFIGDAYGANYLPLEYAGFLARRTGKGIVGTETCSTVSLRGEYFKPFPGYDLHWPHENDYPPDTEFEHQERNPAVYGEFVWTGFDYLGEPDPCCGPARTSYFGIFDLAGFPKDRYWMYKAQWRPDVPTAYILPHWNHPGREGKKTPVHVYTSGDEAELFVNGVSQGRQKRGRYQYRFRWDDVVYNPGVVEVKTWKNGQPWANDREETAGPVVRLERETRTFGKFHFVTVKAVDAKGRFCPTACDWLVFSTGVGSTLNAVCNGDPTDRTAFSAKSMRLFNGLCLAIVEGDASQLDVKLAAESHVVKTPRELRAAIASRSAKGGVIELIGDDWRFGVDDAAELKFFISNHDQSPSHRVNLPIVGCTNLILRGHGQTLRFDGRTIGAFIHGSENVRIENLRFDWASPALADAVIVEFREDETVVSLDPAAFPHHFETLANGDVRLLRDFEGGSAPAAPRMLFSGATHEIIERTGDVAEFRTAKLTPLDGHRFAIGADCSEIGAGAKAGDIVCIRPEGRFCPAVVVDHAKDVVLQDVVVHTASGMGLIAQMSENVAWRGTRPAAERTSGVFPPAGTPRVTTLHADASHFSNVRGSVVVENCWFETMMDDALNVHSTCLGIVAKEAPDRLRCRYMHPQAYGFDVFDAGDVLRFIKGKTLENGREIRVAKVERTNERELVLTLSEAVPEEYGVGDAVENATYQPSVVFRGNVVRNNRARGILLTTPEPCLVEDNLFDHVSGTAILFAGDAQGWYESGACADVTVRRNVFRNCLTSRYQFCEGVISAYPMVRDLEGQKTSYHRGIRIVDNVFETFDVPLLFALSTSEIDWRGNRTEKNGDYRSWGRPPFNLVRSSFAETPQEAK